MARAQTWLRGLLRAGAVQVTTLGATTLDLGSNTLSSANNVLVVGSPLSAKPSADRGVAFGIVSNSTGVAMVVNTTGTTWKYLNVTALQPT